MTASLSSLNLFIPVIGSNLFLAFMQGFLLITLMGVKHFDIDIKGCIVLFIGVTFMCAKELGEGMRDLGKDIQLRSFGTSSEILDKSFTAVDDFCCCPISIGFVVITLFTLLWRFSCLISDP